MYINYRTLSMMSPNKKARLIAFIAVALIIILASLYYLYVYKGRIISDSASSTPSAAVVIKSKADLQTALTSIDGVDLGVIDRTLTQNDADVVGF